MRGNDQFIRSNGYNPVILIKGRQIGATMLAALAAQKEIYG